jgi:hypothetical protein
VVEDVIGLALPHPLHGLRRDDVLHLRQAIFRAARDAGGSKPPVPFVGRRTLTNDGAASAADMRQSEKRR